MNIYRVSAIAAVAVLVLTLCGTLTSPWVCEESIVIAKVELGGDDWVMLTGVNGMVYRRYMSGSGYLTPGTRYCISGYRDFKLNF